MWNTEYWDINAITFSSEPATKSKAKTSLWICLYILEKSLKRFSVSKFVDSTFIISN